MGNKDDVLERSVFAAGNVFIKAGSQNNQAYVIQSGRVRAYVVEDGQEIDVAEYGSGIIVGEISLMLDEPLRMNYQALDDTTVVIINRHDFKRKYAQSDNTLKKIMGFLINKLNHHDTSGIEQATVNIELDETAMFLIDSLTSGMPLEKQKTYKEAMLPDIAALMNTIKKLKNEEKFEAERLAAAKSLGSITSQETA